MRFLFIIMMLFSQFLIADNSVELALATPHPSSSAEHVPTRDEMRAMAENICDRSKPDQDRAHSLLMYERAMGMRENAEFERKPQWLKELILFWNALNE